MERGREEELWEGRRIWGEGDKWEGKIREMGGRKIVMKREKKRGRMGELGGKEEEKRGKEEERVTEREEKRAGKRGEMGGMKRKQGFYPSIKLLNLADLIAMKNADF